MCHCRGNAYNLTLGAPRRDENLSVWNKLYLSYRWPHIWLYRLLRYSENFTANSVTARCPGPVALKKAQVIKPPPACLLNSYEMFVLSCACLVCPKDIPKVLWVFRCNFAKLRHVAIVFLERSLFLLAAQHTLVQSFLHYARTALTFTFNLRTVELRPIESEL